MRTLTLIMLPTDKFSADWLQTSLPWWRKDGFSDMSVEASQCQRDPSSEHVNKWSGLEGWKWTSHTGSIKPKPNKTTSEQVSSTLLSARWLVWCRTCTYKNPGPHQNLPFLSVCGWETQNPTLRYLLQFSHPWERKETLFCCIFSTVKIVKG